MNPYLRPRSLVHLTGEQCRLACGLIGMTQAELARAAGVRIDVVRRLEADDRVGAVSVRNIRLALEARKVVFPAGELPRISP